MENIERFLTKIGTVIDEKDVEEIRLDLSRLTPTPALKCEEDEIGIHFYDEDDYDDDYNYYECPNCGTELGLWKKKPIGRLASHFCPNCGQALTFSNASYTYVKKPVEIEAFCLGEEEMPHWFVVARVNGIVRYKDLEDGVDIDTLEGTMHADLGDYIIKGVEGELYPCDPESFDKTYEKVSG